MRFHTVLLDVDGTLLDYEKAEAAALAAAFARGGHDWSPAVLRAYRRINESLWRAYEKGEIKKDTLLAGRFSALFAELGTDENGTSFNEMYLSCLAETAFPLPGAAELCRRLYQAGVTLAVASNGVAWAQRNRLANASLLPYFEGRLFVSDEAGAAKPDRAFFEYAWQALGRPDKEKMLMVGDSVNADMAGGRHFGIKTCLFAPRDCTRQGQNLAPESADFTIDCLQNVVSLVLDGGEQ